jgi:hypothetical protein
MIREEMYAIKSNLTTTVIIIGSNVMVVVEAIERLNEDLRTHSEKVEQIELIQMDMLQKIEKNEDIIIKLRNYEERSTDRHQEKLQFFNQAGIFIGRKMTEWEEKFVIKTEAINENLARNHNEAIDKMGILLIMK